MLNSFNTSVLPEQCETTVCCVEISTLSIAVTIWFPINAIVRHIMVLMPPAADVIHRDDCAAIEKGGAIIFIAAKWFYGQKSTLTHLNKFKMNQH